MALHRDHCTSAVTTAWVPASVCSGSLRNWFECRALYGMAFCGRRTYAGCGYWNRNFQLKFVGDVVWLQCHILSLLGCPIWNSYQAADLLGWGIGLSLCGRIHGQPGSVTRNTTGMCRG